MAIEPGTAIVGGGLILASRDLLNKLLGPTADYIGKEAQNLVEKCNINIDNIFRKAFRKLGDKINTPGVVSPRVLRDVMDEGRFIEDELAAEYYGGILASSRTEDGRDDRAVTYLNVIKQLSTYQIRLHYLFYMTIKQIFDGKNLNIQLGDDRHKMAVYISFDVFHGAMDFEEHELKAEPTILVDSVVGLYRQDLITEHYRTGGLEHIKEEFEHAEDGGIIMRPSLFGASLFLWVSGHADRLPRELIERNVTAGEPIIKIIDGALPINEEFSE